MSAYDPKRTLGTAVQLAELQVVFEQAWNGSCDDDADN